MGCDEKLFVTAHDFLICRLLKELQKPVDRLNKYRFNGIECYLKLILEALFNLNIEVNACRSFEIAYALYYGGCRAGRFVVLIGHGVILALPERFAVELNLELWLTRSLSVNSLRRDRSNFSLVD